MSTHLSSAVTDDQRTTLNTLVRAGSARARMLLLLDRHQAAPWTDEAMAQAVRCHRNTVGNVRRRFRTADLKAALYHKPLPPRTPKKWAGEGEAHLMALAGSASPAGQQRWTLRLLVDRLVERGLVERRSHVAIGAR